MAGSDRWQRQGYQKLAYLQAAHPDTAIYRRFSPLNAHVLLALQARLINLQFDLEKLCHSDDASSIGDEKSFSTNFNALFASKGSTQGSQGAQLAKLEEIQGVMTQYYDLLAKSAQLGHMSRPETYQVRFLDTWLWMQNSMKGFLVSQEALTWDSRYRDDFVSLFPTDSWLNPWIIDFFHRLRYGPETAEKKTEADVELGPIQQVDNLYLVRTSIQIWRLFVTLSAAMLPVLAILILYFVKRTLYRIAIAVGLTAIAGLFLKAFTAAQTKEIFGATAA